MKAKSIQAKANLWRRSGTALFGIVICALLLALLFLRDDVSQHFDRMRRATAGALIWNTAQYEVDLARFGTAFATMHGGAPNQLPPDVLRRWRALQNRHAVLHAGAHVDDIPLIARCRNCCHDVIVGRWCRKVD